MKLEKETLVYIFCILVLTGLSVRIITTEKTLSCGQCEVTFKDKAVTEQIMDERFTYKVEDLFLTYINEDECIVWWDPVQGFGGFKNEYAK